MARKASCHPGPGERVFRREEADFSGAGRVLRQPDATNAWLITIPAMGGAWTMSPATTANPAWITVPAEDALPPDADDEIGPIAKKIGFTPNVARLLAITPEHLVRWWSYFDELMRGPSGLTKTQRELIAVVVSAEARCPYCVTAHAAGLRMRVKDAAFVDRLAVNYRQVELPEQDRVMLDYAVKLTRAPDECSENDITRLREVGFTDTDILHIVEVAAFFNLGARLAAGTGLQPNLEYHQLGRAAAREG